MDSKLGKIILYLVIGIIAVRFGIPILFKALGLLITLAVGAVGLVFTIIFTVVPLVVIGWIIYVLFFKNKANH